MCTQSFPSCWPTFCVYGGKENPAKHSFAFLVRLTAYVKACKTPAPSSRHYGMRKSSQGRRLTSLEGGSCGVLSVEWGYGDLKIVS